MAAVAAVNTASQRWVFPIEASEMGRIFPRNGIVHLLFISAEKAAAFQRQYPSIGNGERTYTLITSKNEEKNLEIVGPLGSFEAIDALYSAIHNATPADTIIENPYTFTLGH